MLEEKEKIKKKMSDEKKKVNFFFTDFGTFIRKQKIPGLAIAFVLGMISSDLVKAIVNDLIMPFIGAILPNNDWQSFVLAAGPLKLALGHFMSVFINFLIILLVVYLVIRWMTKLNLVES